MGDASGSKELHALVFGASGICGWAIANQCLSYPSKDTFKQITALTNRPLSKEDSGWPVESRLNLVSGIDLTLSEEEIYDALRSKTNTQNVTHVFYAAYIQDDDPVKQKEINARMLQSAIKAVLRLTVTNLKAVVLQTGLKHYGVEVLGMVPFKLPLKESAPRITQAPFKNLIFYYDQVDILQELSAGQDQWRYYEIRPDVIVGFTPGSCRYNIAHGHAFYFTLFRERYGVDAEVPFPGTLAACRSKHQDSFQDVIAQRAIHAAINSESIPSGTAFNSPDRERLTSWEEKWSRLVAYFGLNGVGPGPVPLNVATFAGVSQGVWDRLVHRHGLRSGLVEKYRWDFIAGVCSWYAIDRYVDVANSKKYGFKGSVETVDGYVKAFHRMRAAKIIP